MWQQTQPATQQLLHIHPIGMSYMSGASRHEVSATTATQLATRTGQRRNITSARTIRTSINDDEKSSHYHCTTSESTSLCSQAEKKTISSTEFSQTSESQDQLPDRTDKEIVDVVRVLFDEFGISRQNEEIDINNMETTKSTAQARQCFVRNRLLEIKQRYADAKVLHEKTLGDLAIYHGDAEAFSQLSTDQIHKVCDMLNRSKETATVAHALYNTKEHPEETPYEESLLLPEDEKKYFEVLQLPTLASTGRRTHEIISKLIEELKCLHAKETRNFAMLEDGYDNIKQIQAEHEQLIASYHAQVEQVHDIEKKQYESTKELNILEDPHANMDSMTIEDLKTFSATVGKYLRTAHLALAVQQLEEKGVCARGSTGGILLSDNARCVVCFEQKWNTSLSPCGHVLCSGCADRLHFCPTCRTPIESYQRMYV